MGEVEEEEEGGSRRKVRVTVLEREGEDMEASFWERGGGGGGTINKNKNKILVWVLQWGWRVD